MNDSSDDLTALGLLDDPVRRRVYDWVVTQGRPVGREETAKALEITRALATFHLDKLATAGLLDADYRRLTGRVGPGAGRPARVYWRAPREFNVTLPSRRYERAAEIFARALERLDDDAVRAGLRAAAAELAESVADARSRRHGHGRLVAALADGGYEPVSDNAGVIRLRNCPFHALVERHRPLVCGANLAFAEGLTRVARVGDLEPILDQQPGYCCVAFVPRQPSDTRARTGA